MMTLGKTLFAPSGFVAIMVLALKINPEPNKQYLFLIILNTRSS